MRVLIDTNILLDAALSREPFAEAARQVIEACARGDADGIIAAITPLNAFYVACNTVGNDEAREMVLRLLDLFEVCPLGEAALRAAYESGQADLEDATQLAAALAVGVEAIVTRDPRGFAHAAIPVFSPSDFLAQLSK